MSADTINRSEVTPGTPEHSDPEGVSRTLLYVYEFFANSGAGNL